jgi:N utilization substance protein A
MQGSSNSLQSIIEQVSKEKGIDSSVLTETMEQAILTAAKRSFGMSRELEARYNAETGNVDLFQYMIVVDAVTNDEREIASEEARRYGLEAEIGEELGFQIFYMPDDAEKARQQDKEFGDLLKMQQHRRGFGRIAAQTAKQVIIQRVRDAERELVFNEFKERRGELISGVVRRFERGDAIIVDLNGRTEAVLPKREQTPRENYRPGDRIVSLLKDIDREARGPQVVLSRTDVGILVKLFEMEVPEIYEGIVKIVAAAREPGARSKIAVTSRDSDVDPVGACVGMKGSRVQAVVQELRGEKIDIVPFDRDPARFVCNAIAPAEVSRVIIDEGNHSMELVVPDAKLSLAIGRRGQNVRLASQLTGWRLDIISDTRFRQIEDQALESLGMMPSVDETLAKSFYRSGFRTVDEVAEANDAEIQTIDGVGSAARAEKLRIEAAGAMDKYRAHRIQQVIARGDLISERDMLVLASGVTERVADALERGGYRGVQEVLREGDVDRLAIRTGLGNQKAREIQEAIQRFVDNDLEKIRAAQRASVARASDGALPVEGESGNG